jgi:hypothetical protein
MSCEHSTNANTCEACLRKRHEAAMSKTPRTDAGAFEVWTKDFGNVEVVLIDDARTLELELAESQRYVRIYGAEVKERNALLDVRDRELAAARSELEKVNGERDEAREEAATFEMIGDDMICLYGESNAALSTLRARLSSGVKGRIIEAGNLEATGKPGLLIESTVDELRGKAWIGECVVLKETGKDG